MDWLIVNIVEGRLGVIRSEDTYEKALKTATDMAYEQCSPDSYTKRAVRAELKADNEFVTPGGDIRVYIAQAE